MVTSFKSSHAHTATGSAPNPAAGHCRPTPPWETPGPSWASLAQSLMGSLLLSSGSWCTQGFVCALHEMFPKSCVSSGGSVVGLMATSSKRAYQHHSSKASILWHSAFFTVQLSQPYMTTGKTIALTRRTFVGKVMSLLLNMLLHLLHPLYISAKSVIRSGLLRITDLGKLNM